MSRHGAELNPNEEAFLSDCLSGPDDSIKAYCGFSR